MCIIIGIAFAKMEAGAVKKACRQLLNLHP